MKENNTKRRNINPERDEVEINLLDLCRFYLRHWLILLIAIVVGAGIGWGYNHFAVGTTYSAEASIFVGETGTKNDLYELSLKTDSQKIYAEGYDEGIDADDIAISSELMLDYQAILESKQTKKAVIEDLGLDMTYSQLDSIVGIAYEDESHVIRFTATTGTAELARDIANSMVKVGSERINEITTTCEAAVIDYATDDTITANSGGKKEMAIGAFLIFVIMCIILLVKYLMDHSFKSEDEIVNKLGIPVIASVPYYGERNLIRDTLSCDEKEAINALYGNIVLIGEENKVVAVTAAKTGEGSSTLAFKLAEMATEYNRKACYVDCDMRNSAFNERYGLATDAVNAGGDDKGLAGLLGGAAELSETLIKDVNNDKLCILPAGKRPTNPSALLAGDKFDEVLEELRKQFDYIFLDAPAVSEVIDGMFVAKKSDATVMVIEDAVTDSREVVRAFNSLNMSDADIIGIAVNKTGRKGM